MVGTVGKSGKSALFNILGGNDRPSAGWVQLPAEYVRALGINGRARAHLDGDPIVLERG